MLYVYRARTIRCVASGALLFMRASAAVSKSLAVLRKQSRALNVHHFLVPRNVKHKIQEWTHGSVVA